MLSVYAKTVTTRRLLTNGQQAYVFGRPVVRSSVGDWRLLGSAVDFAAANELTRDQAAADAESAAETRRLPGGIPGVDVGRLTIETTRGSVFQASGFVGERLRWYERAPGGAGPLEGWMPIGGPR